MLFLLTSCVFDMQTVVHKLGNCSSFEVRFKLTDFRRQYQPLSFANKLKISYFDIERVNLQLDQVEFCI